jgi:hypothetical protein
MRLRGHRVFRLLQLLDASQQEMLRASRHASRKGHACPASRPRSLAALSTTQLEFVRLQWQAN